MLPESRCWPLLAKWPNHARNLVPIRPEIPVHHLWTGPELSCSTGILSHLGAKLRDCAIRQGGASYYSWAELSSNDSKTRYSFSVSFHVSLHSGVDGRLQEVLLLSRTPRQERPLRKVSEIPNTK